MKGATMKNWLKWLIPGESAEVDFVEKKGEKKKCTNCGKKIQTDSLKFCGDCGGKLEQELEEVLPAETVKFLKKDSVVYIITLAVIVIMISILTGLVVRANNSVREQRDIVSGLNLDLTKKGNELTALQTTLSQTEEGKKQIETAKAQVDDQNKALDTRATSAEQTASKAKSDLAGIQASLTKTQADLAAKQAELNSKQTELNKVNRGITMFDSAKSLFDSYDNAAKNIAQNMINYTDALDRQDTSQMDYYYDQIQYWASQAISYRDQINALFTKIKSGNY